MKVGDKVTFRGTDRYTWLAVPRKRCFGIVESFGEASVISSCSLGIAIYERETGRRVSINSSDRHPESLWYFLEEDLELWEEAPKERHLRTVRVVYPNSASGTLYSFKTELEDIKIGDHLVVKASTGIGLVRIVDIREGVDERATAWAFQKVDLSLLGVLTEKDRIERAEKQRKAREEAKRKREELEERAQKARAEFLSSPYETVVVAEISKKQTAQTPRSQLAPFDNRKRFEMLEL